MQLAGLLENYIQEAIDTYSKLVHTKFLYFDKLLKFQWQTCLFQFHHNMLLTN